MASEVPAGGHVTGKIPSVPNFQGGQFTVVGTDKEIIILLGSAAIAIDDAGAPSIVAKPVAQVTIPVLAAKELIVLLKEAVDGVEADIGVTTNEFLRAR